MEFCSKDDLPKDYTAVAARAPGVGAGVSETKEALFKILFGG